SPRNTTLMESMFGEWTGKVRSTAMPKEILRTVKVSRTPPPWRRMTTPLNSWMRSFLPSTILTLTSTVSPARKSGMSSRSDAASTLSRMFMESFPLLFAWTEDPGGTSPWGRSAGSCPKHVKPPRARPMGGHPRSTGPVCHGPLASPKSLAAWDAVAMPRFPTNSTSASAPSPAPRWERRALAGFVVAPLLGMAALVAWALSVMDRLPDPVAVHFGARGEADGFGGLTGLLVILVAVTLPILPMGLIGSWRRNPRMIRKTLGP